ncbi:toxin glutamine deamidase domain-containing protein [Nocardia terpenica]|uniref:toxin glutamine deamidase domain-containing protein n=1 Tax=Nocardia terpenica TaxID=455432 RepID=UPI0012FD5D52|nr:toxin glutamine deamidase domain-containing protein [Nocardia terpenica]
MPTGHGPNAKSAYDFRRYPDAPGGPIAVAGIKVHVTFDRSVSPDQVGRVWERAQLATDLAFNHGQRLLSGDRVLVDLVHTPDPAAANLHIHVSDTPGPWHPDSHPDAIARQLREQLGLPPEPGQHGRGLSPDEIRRISNDIAKANTPARFRGLEEGHRYGRGRLRALEDPAYQHAVEDALRDGNRFLIGADPRTNAYGQLINDGGPERPGRRNNCLVQSLAALSSFHGDPQVGLARWPDERPDGSIDDRTGEQHGLERAQKFLGGQWANFARPGTPIHQQFAELHNWMHHQGPGSSALVINGWHARDPRTGQPLFHPNGAPVIDGTHATIIVYPHGASGPVWWDPQARTMSDHPPRAMVDGSAQLMFMTTPDPGASHATGIHPGTSRTVSGPDLSDRPGMADPSVPERVDLSAGTHTGTDHGRTGPGPDELGDRLGHGGGDRVPELVDGDGGRGLHGSEADRTPTDGRSDLPAEAEGEHPSHTGRFGDDPISDPRRFSDGTTGPDRGIPSEHQQEHSGLPADRLDGGERGRVGGMAERPERDVAGRGNLRGMSADDGVPWLPPSRPEIPIVK